MVIINCLKITCEFIKIIAITWIIYWSIDLDKDVDKLSHDLLVSCLKKMCRRIVLSTSCLVPFIFMYVLMDTFVNISVSFTNTCFFLHRRSLKAPDP